MENVPFVYFVLLGRLFYVIIQAYDLIDMYPKQSVFSVIFTPGTSVQVDTQGTVVVL